MRFKFGLLWILCCHENSYAFMGISLVIELLGHLTLRLEKTTSHLLNCWHFCIAICYPCRLYGDDAPGRCEVGHFDLSLCVSDDSGCPASLHTLVGHLYIPWEKCLLAYFAFLKLIFERLSHRSSLYFLVISLSSG